MRVLLLRILLFAFIFCAACQAEATSVSPSSTSSISSGASTVLSIGKVPTVSATQVTEEHPYHLETITPQQFLSPSIQPVEQLLPMPSPLAVGDSNSHELVFRVPVGDVGIHYAGEHGTEIQKTGPSAMVVADDGSFWIVDTVGQQVLHYSIQGAQLGAISLNDQKHALVDMVILQHDILLLDLFPNPPAILRCKVDGTLQTRYEIPASLSTESGLSGITANERGEIILEMTGGTSLYRLVDANGEIALAPLDGYQRAGQRYTAYPVQPTSSNLSHGIIVAGDRQVEVSVAHELAGLQVLGINSDGSFYVVVEEMISSPTILVDQLIHYYSATGILLGIARMPLAEQYTYVAHALAVGPDGAVYGLMTRPDHGEVRRLIFAKRVDSLLP